MQHFLSQLLFAALAFAAPIADETVKATAGGNAWQYGTGGGILGLIVLILDVIVFGSCSPSPSTYEPCTDSSFAYSRSHQIQPSSLAQAALVAPGLYLPHRRSHSVLAVLRPLCS